MLFYINYILKIKCTFIMNMLIYQLLALIVKFIFTSYEIGIKVLFTSYEIGVVIQVVNLTIMKKQYLFINIQKRYQKKVYQNL